MLVRHPLEPARTPVAVVVDRRAAVGRVPVGALPARGLAEAGVARGESRVKRRVARRPRRLHLPVRPVHGVEQAQALAHAGPEVALVALERVEAGDVDRREVHGRAALDHPLRHRHPDAAAGEDALRVEAGGDEEVLHLRRLADDERVVRREALRAVHEVRDLARARAPAPAPWPCASAARSAPSPRAARRTRSRRAAPRAAAACRRARTPPRSACRRRP